MLTPRRSVRLLAPVLLGTGAACGRPPVPPQQVQDHVVVDGLRLQATTRVWGAAPESVGVSVRVTNQRPTVAELGYGLCVLAPQFVRLARADARPGRLPGGRWDARWRTYPFPQPDGSVRRVREVCPLMALRAQLAPGASEVPREFTWHSALDAVRGDSLHGPYRVVARLDQILGREGVEVPAGTVRLP